jgi:hypothetical protein
MTFGTAAIAIGGATVVGAYMTSQAAKSAAQQYSDTASRGLQYNQQMFDKINEQNQPYRDVGLKGANLYGIMADNGYLTASPSMDDLTKLMPNYKFGMQQGIGQFNAQQNAAGGAISGNAIQGGQMFAQDYAGNSLNNAFNQYQANRTNVVSNVNALTGVGQNANTTTANAATGASANSTSLLSSIGNAQAQGTMGAANAYQNGINSLSQYAMLYGMKNSRTA